MSIADSVRRLRDALPPRLADVGLDPVRWLLLDGNRHAVTTFLFGVVFLSLLAMGEVWPFEMRQLLTETDAVQTILNTLLGGIILLVSIVVSINSVVLSYDLASLGQQRERIEESMQFRYDLGDYIDPGNRPTDPGIFLEAILTAIDDQAAALESTAADSADAEVRRDVVEYADDIRQSVDRFQGRLEHLDEDELANLWLGLDYDYTRHLDRTQDLELSVAERDDAVAESLGDLVDLFELFATGKEYFKTLYYSMEFSTLSRTLISVSLPAIIINAASILAIDAGLLPDVWLLGLPPLMTFVAGALAVSLLPFLVLTSFTLRAATVAKKTVAAGPFVLDA